MCVCAQMQCEEGTEWLLELLTDVQLQHYFLRIRDELNVTRLSHFDYVKNEDLEKIGMGRPGDATATRARRLAAGAASLTGVIVWAQVRGDCGRPSRGEEHFINANPG